MALDIKAVVKKAEEEINQYAKERIAILVNDLDTIGLHQPHVQVDLEETVSNGLINVDQDFNEIPFIIKITVTV